MAGANKKLFAALGIGGLGYGGLIGLNATIQRPKDIDQARQNATLGSLIGNITRDTAIGLADDAIIFAAAPFLVRRLPIWEKGLKNVVNGGLALGGSAVGGVFAGRDFQQFVAARQYVQNYDRNMAGNGSVVSSYSPNRISGFNNQGQAGAQRVMMTGISSPSSDSIMYRMENNPFGQMLNGMVTNRATDPNQVSDPRAKALSFGYLGGIIGGVLGARRGGLAGAAIGSLIGGGLAGTYGVYQSHNPSLSANLQAFGDVAKVSGAPLAAGALLFGATRIPGVGKFLGKGLTFTGSQIARGGRALEDKGVQNMLGGQINIERARTATNTQITKLTPVLEKAKIMNFKMKAGPADFIMNTLYKGSDLAFGSAQMTMGIASNLNKNILIPTMKETDSAGKSMWMQSLALGHTISFGATQYFAATSAANVYKERRGKHATNTMPSNSPR